MAEKADCHPNTILRTMSMQEAHKNSLKSRTDPTQMTGTLDLL